MCSHEQIKHVESGCKERETTPFRCFFSPISLKNVSNVFFPTIYAHDSTINLPFFKADYDSVRSKSKTTKDLSRINETGLDRLKQMFSTDDYGRIGPEWTMIIHGTYGGVIAGSFIGGLSGARRAKDLHLRDTHATKFQTEMHARRALQDRITLTFMKDAAKYGAKMGGFTFSYIFMTTISSVYRGNTNVFDFVVGGAISGALWRITVGPKAALVSGALGTILGLFAGGLSVLALRFSDTSFEEIRYWHYHSHIVTKRSEVFGNEVEVKDPIDVSQQDNKDRPSTSEAVDLKSKTSN